MISLRRHAQCLAVAVGCWALCAQARADDAAPAGSDGGATNPVTVERAQQLLRDGNEMFWAGRVSEALQAFEDAHRLYPSPKLYFNIARCEAGLQRRARALTHYQQFLREAHEGDPQVRAEAERQVTALIPSVATLELRQVPANAAVRIDGESAGLTPIEGPLWVEPGAHRLSIELAGRPPWIGTVEAKGGETIAVTLPAPEVSTPPAGTGGEAAGRNDGAIVAPRPPEGAQPSRLRRWWWLWAGIGVALIGGATAIYLSTRCPVSSGVCE
jgi:hypothetical protein